MTAPLDEQAMRERHVERSETSICEHCGLDWPCDTIQALDALGEAREEIAVLRPGAEHYNRERIRANQAEATLAELSQKLATAKRVVEAAQEALATAAGEGRDG